jgi:hypothetical protein
MVNAKTLHSSPFALRPSLFTSPLLSNIHMRTTYLRYLGLLLVLLACIQAQAQQYIRYKLERDAAGTYRVYISSTTTYTAATISTAQVTWLVPTGTLPEIPQGTSPTNYLGIWNANSRVPASQIIGGTTTPPAGFDFLSIGLAGGSVTIPGGLVAGQDRLLFSFATNPATCPTGVRLWQPGDPDEITFNPAGQVGVANQMTIFRPGSPSLANTYLSNYGSNPPPCVAADLISQLGPAPPLTEGQTAQLPFSLTNIGNGPTTGPTSFTVALPASVSAPASFSGLNGFGCTTVGQLVTCSTLNGLPPGGPYLVNIPITPLPGTAGQQPPFTGVVQTAPDGNSSNNNPAPLTGPVIQGAVVLTPDLYSSIGPVPPLQVGVVAQVPVTVGNIGTGPAAGPIVYTTTLASSLSAPAFFTAANGWGCTTISQTVSCTNAGPLLPGSTIPFTIPVTPLPGTQGQQPSFSGGVTSPSGDTNPNNNISPPFIVQPILPATTPPSACTLVDCGTGVRYGLRLDPDGITYRVYMMSANVYSGIQARIATAQATVKVPTGMQIANVVSYNNTTWTMNARVNAPTENTSRDYLSFGYSQPGVGQAFNIPANTEIQLFSFQRVGACTGEVALWGGYTAALEPFQGASTNTNPGNQMTLYGEQQNTGNANFNSWNCNYTCPAVCPSVQLSLVKLAPAGITQGVPFNYTMQVLNTGTGPTSGQLTVTDVLPSGLQFVSGGGNGWVCSALGQTVTCTSSGPISASGVSSFALQVNPVSLGNISNSATLTGGGSLTSIPSSPCVNCPVGPTVSPVSPGASDLALTLSLGGPLAAGQPNTLNAQVSNLLTSAAAGPLTVNVTLPSGISAPGTFALPGGWGCMTSATVQGNVVSCTNAAGLAGSGSALLPIPITPSAAMINNPVLITGNVPGVPSETNLGNNSAFLISNVVGADLAVSFGTIPTLVPNSPAFIPVTVTNLGQASAPGTLTVNVTLPSGVNFNGSAALPAGWSVAGVVPSGTGQVVTLLYSNPGGLAANGGNVGINVPVLVGPVTGSPQFQVAVVPMPSENNLPNNSATASAGTAGGPDLSVTVSGPTPALVVNQPSVVQFTVTNVGSQPATGPFSVTTTFPPGYTVNISQPLPAGWGYGSVLTGPAGTTVVLTNNSPSLLPLGSVAVSLTATPPASSGGQTGSIGAVVNPASGETNLGNNSGSLTVTPNSAGIGGSITLPVAFTIGQPGNVLIILANNGNSPYNGPLSTTLILPTGVTPGTLPSGWVYGPVVNNGNGTVSYPINSVGNILLMPGGNTTIIVPVTPAPTTPGTSVIVYLTTPATPGVPSTNVTIVQVAPLITPQLPNVTVLVQSPSASFGVGQPAIINVVLNNFGPGAVNGPTNLTITLPAGLTLAPGQLPAGWSILSTSPNGSNTVYVLTNPNVQIPGNGGSLTVPFVVNIGQGAYNTAPVVTVVVLPTPQPQPSTGILFLPTIGAPNMVLQVGQPTPTLVINQLSNLPVTISNNGNAPAFGPLTVNVVLPNGVQYVAGSQVLPSGWVYSGSALQGSQTVLIFSNPNAAGFGSGSSVQFNVPIMAVSGAGTTPSFTVYVSPVAGQPTGPSVTIITTLPIQNAATPDLTIIAYQPVPGLAVNQPSSISVVMQNVGGAPSSGPISFQIAVPTGMTLNQSSLPAGWFVSNVVPVAGGFAYTLTNNALIIGANSAASLQLQVVPGSSLAGAFITMGFVVNGVPGEIILTNNSYSLVINVPVQGAAVPDLAVTIPAGQTIGLAVGQTSLLSFNVSNIGAAAANGPLSLTFAMPAGFTTNPGTFASGGWGCTTAGNIVTCQNASGLGINASSAITIPVVPTGAAAGIQNPSFLINVGAASGETVLFNNVGTIQVLGSVTGPDLAVSFPAQSFTLVGGQTSNVLVQVQNNSMATAAGPLSLTFAMPAGFFSTNPTSFVTNGWSCTTTGSTVGCTYPFGLAASGSTSLTIPLMPSAAAGGVVLNPSFVAVVAPVAGETFLLNNSAQLLYNGLVQVGQLQLAVKALLGGPYSVTAGLMNDDLRTLGYIPLTQPYLTTPVVSPNVPYAFPVTVANMATTNAVLAVSGPNAIVDWVVVELRSGSNNTVMISSLPALIQRDGDIVMASDGVSPLTFTGVAPGAYFVVVRHRNHLGIMSAQAVMLGGALASVNLTVGSNVWVKGGSFGSHPTYSLPTAPGVALMWPGNVYADAAVIFQGGNADITPIINTVLNANSTQANFILWGYNMADINLDGRTIFQGPGNEPDLIFYEVMSHPGNQTTQLANYIIHQHLP